MWRNTIVIHSILKGKKLQSKIFNQLNIKKVKLTKIILEKKKIKKKEKVQKKMKKYEKMNCELLL
jgi:ribosomal protein L14E/L6E/L27E